MGLLHLMKIKKNPDLCNPGTLFSSGSLTTNKDDE